MDSANQNDRKKRQTAQQGRPLFVVGESIRNTLVREQWERMGIVLSLLSTCCLHPKDVQQSLAKRLHKYLYYTDMLDHLNMYC